MSDYFIRANSFAAPFFSDDSSSYQAGETPEKALLAFAKAYKHPAGLYAALAYTSADAYHKGEPALATWLCNHEIAKMEATKNLGSYGYFGDGPGHFKINEEWHTVKNPRAGRIVEQAHA